MNTSYEDIFKIFLGKISDFNLSRMSDYELYDYCYEIMRSAITKIDSIKNNFEDMDDELMTFNSELSALEIEILTTQMVVEWIDKQINTTQLLRMFVGTKEESMSSQANHITQLINLKDKQRSIVSNLIRDYNYKKWIKEAN